MAIHGISKDCFLKLLEILWGSSLKRLGSVIAVAGVSSVVGVFQYFAQAIFRGVGFNVDVPEVPIWVSLLLIFIGIIVVALAEVALRHENLTQATAHDIDLYRKFQDLITNNQLEFLRNHDFGASFRTSEFDRVGNFAETWHGPRFELNDKNIDELFSKVKLAADDFVGVLVVKTGPLNQVSGRSSVKRDFDNDFDLPEHIQDGIRELNSKAEKLVEAVDEFERVATARLAGR